MKKYKMLLCGRGRAVINDFFFQTDFECLSTSIRYDDVISHLRFYKPDAFVYCIQDEEKEDIARVKTFQPLFRKLDIKTVIIGEQNECSAFERVNVGVANLILVRPIKSKVIEERINDMLREHEKMKQGGKDSPAAAGTAASGSAATGAAEPKSVSAGGSAASGSAPAPEAKRKHVLVVDDDIRMLKVVKEHLKDKYDVATAINGKLALKFLENKTTDLILLDYVMPGESGPEVFQQLKENPNTQNIPVLFVTGVDDLSKIQEVLKLKPRGYLLKPIDRDKLIASVSGILG